MNSPDDSVEAINSSGDRARWQLFAVAWALLAGLLGTAFSLFATSSYGAGISTDSVFYVAGARNILAGNGLVDFTGARLVAFPPLFPWALSLVSRLTHADPLVTGRWLNAILFGLIIISPLAWPRQKGLARTALLFVLPAFLLFSPWLFKTSVMLWTEPLFIVLTIAHLLSLSAALERASLVMLFFSACLCGLSTLTRYVGAASLLAGAISTVLLVQGSVVRRLKWAGLFAVVAGLPLVVWVIRNLMFSGHLFGDRAFAPGALLHFPVMIWSAFAGLGTVICTRGSVLAGFVALAGLGLSIWVFVRVWRVNRGFIVFLLPWGTLVVMQIIALLVGAGTPDGWHNQLLLRYTAPLYALIGLPCLGMLFVGLDTLVGERRRRAIFMAGCVLGCFALIFPVAAITLEGVSQFRSSGPGDYSSEAWRNNQTLDVLRQHRDSIKARKVYSNAPDILYILCGINSTTTPKLSDLQESRRNWPASAGGVVVWLPERARTYLVDIQALVSEFHLSPVVTLPDGLIACVSPASAMVRPGRLLSLHTKETIGLALSFCPPVKVEIASADDEVSQGVMGQLSRLLSEAGWLVRSNAVKGGGRAAAQAFVFSAASVPPESVLDALRPLVDEFAAQPVFNVDDKILPGVLHISIDLSIFAQGRSK